MWRIFGESTEGGAPGLKMINGEIVFDLFDNGPQQMKPTMSVIYEITIPLE
jgi:hypothetical protein